MTENVSNAENSAEQRPFQRIEWNGSVAEIYDTVELIMPSYEGSIVYDRSDFQTPIERIQVTVQQIDNEGETGTALTAVIKLDRTRDDYMRNPSYGKSPLLKSFLNDAAYTSGSPFIPYDQKDKGLWIEGTTFNNVHKISDANGNKILVWVVGDKKQIIVSNHLSLNNENKNKHLEVRPSPHGTVEPEAVYEGFFKAFMRTVDFAAGLDGYAPDSHRLKRTYPIGKEVSTIVGSNQTRHIGHTAANGAGDKKAQNGHEEHSDPLAGIPEMESVETALSLDDIGGLESVKRTLRDIAISFQHPEVMEKWGASRPQGVLLYGAPGTGKTMLTQALAHEMGAELWALQSTDIYEKWLGNSEQRIKEIFDHARKFEGRLVLFFDEFDSIVGISENPTSGGADRARNAVAGIFKQEMNTLAKDNPNVLVVAATNNLDRIDPALVRSGRFDHKVYVPMPDGQSRGQIIAGIIAKTTIKTGALDFQAFADDMNVVQLADETDGMSGADITEIFRRLSLSRAMQEARTGTVQPPITHSEIIAEVRTFRKNG